MNRSFGFATHALANNAPKDQKFWRGAKTQAAWRVHPSKGVLCHVLFFALAVRQEAARTLELLARGVFAFISLIISISPKSNQHASKGVKKSYKIYTLMLLMRPTFFSRCIQLVEQCARQKK